MLFAGGEGVRQLKLLSKDLESMLYTLMAVYKDRYKVQHPGISPWEAAEIKENKSKLDSHGWMLGVLRSATANPGWKAIRDPARPGQPITPLVLEPTYGNGKKRISQTSTYKMESNKRKLLDGERGPTEEEEDEEFE